MSFKTKKVTERTQILGNKLIMKLASKAVKKRCVVVIGHNNVINIKKQIDKVRLLMKDKKGRVSATARKTKCEKK